MSLKKLKIKNKQIKISPSGVLVLSKSLENHESLKFSDEPWISNFSPGGFGSSYVTFT